MRHLHRCPFPLLLTVSASVGLVACGGGGESADAVTLLKPTPSAQCSASASTQAALNEQMALLAAGGATVYAGACGNAATVLPARCGEWNGDLWVVQVSQASVQVARGQGFVDAAQFPSHVTQACAASGG
jgi:hypothetical protein